MKASPFIKECIVVAEGRKFVGALVQIDYETVGQWAQARRIPFTHFRSLAEMAEVRALDRKSTRLNSSHLVISYAVFCLKKKKENKILLSVQAVTIHCTRHLYIQLHIPLHTDLHSHRP